MAVTDGAKDKAFFVPTKRSTKSTKKKAVRRTGPMGTPKRKVAKKRTTKKTRR